MLKKGKEQNLGKLKDKNNKNDLQKETTNLNVDECLNYDFYNLCFNKNKSSAEDNFDVNYLNKHTREEFEKNKQNFNHMQENRIGLQMIEKHTNNSNFNLNDTYPNQFTDSNINEISAVQTDSKKDENHDKDFTDYTNYNNLNGCTISITYRDEIPSEISPDNTEFLTSVHKKILNRNCRNCTRYKNKMKTFKSLSEKYKRKFIKEKQTNEMLNHKLLCILKGVKLSENNHDQNSNYNLPCYPTNSDRVNSTNISKGEEETKMAKLLYEKIQDNNVLFEKLESEIMNKEVIIKKQNETIRHHKQTIDSLLAQFNVFWTQGNYLITDLLILKQTLSTNSSMTKDIEDVNSALNEYTERIKFFSENTKSILDTKEVSEGDLKLTLEEKKETRNELISLKYVKQSCEVVEKEMFEIKAEEDVVNNIDPPDEDESELSFTLTKSNINLEVNKTNITADSNCDKSLNMYDLNKEDFYN